MWKTTVFAALLVALLGGGGAYLWWLRRGFRRALRTIQQHEEALEAANYELVKLAAEAEAANVSKSEFLAVMSHELRTPLTAILGYAEIMAMGVHGPVIPEQARDCERILRSGEHLLNIINSILDYAKLGSHQHGVEMRPVLLRLKIEAAKELVVPQAATKNVTIRYADQAENTWVSGDGDAVKQIVINLLANAVKFTPPGGTITLTTRAVGEFLEFQVHDTGIGIPENKLEAIFRPFVQVDSSMTRAHGGTGLGLAISRELAHAMGGSLTAASTPGQGSTFTLRLHREETMRQTALAVASSGEYITAAADA